MTADKLTRILGRSVITLAGVIVVLLGVSMLMSDQLIQPSATEQYLEEGEARVDIGVDREENFVWWLISQAMRFASGMLLLALGALLMIKPWRGKSRRLKGANNDR